MMATFEAKTKTAAQVAPSRPMSVSPRKAGPLELLVRAAVVKAFAHVHKMSIENARIGLARAHPRYGEEATKIVCRAATEPAMTFNEGWAAEFVVAMGADLIKEVMPKSAFTQLAGLGMQLVFGQGDIMVPNFIPSTPGGFVGEGQPIPVIQGETTGEFLRRKKMAIIISYSGEIAEGAIVSFEGFLRTRLQESLTVAIDSFLLDDAPATDARPAGLLAGAATVLTSGAMLGDLQTLAEALFAGAGNFVRAPVLIVNTAQGFAARMQAERSVIPLIVSPSIEPGTIALIDAADFACASGQPRFEISKDATLHFESEAPEHINFTGAMAMPARSLWQTETIGLRVILEVDWLLRRPNVASKMVGVHWIPAVKD